MLAYTTYCALALLSTSSLVSAQVPATASSTQLSLVDQEYINSGFAAQTNTGIGTSLKSTALLTVQYGFGIVQNGQPYTVNQVAGAPEVYVTPTSDTASSFTSTSKYTLMLADAASLGDPDLAGNYRHFLINGLTGAAGSASNTTFEPVDGTAITNYAAPGPIAGTGPHRYAWLLFTQPSTFAAPANLSSPGTPPNHWNVSSYVQSTGISLVAASFFTVQNGNPTGSVVATSAVNTASLTAASASSSPSSTAPPAANGSGKTAVSLAVALAAVMGAVALV